MQTSYSQAVTKYFREIAASFAAAVFLLSAFSKVQGAAQLGQEVISHQQWPMLSLVAGCLLISAEIVIAVGVCLSTGAQRRYCSAAGMILAVSYTIWILAKPAGYVCPCISILSDKTFITMLEDHPIIRNISLFGALLFVWRGGNLPPVAVRSK